jgi:hypothetical protein
VQQAVLETQGRLVMQELGLPVAELVGRRLHHGQHDSVQQVLLETQVILAP